MAAVRAIGAGLLAVSLVASARLAAEMVDVPPGFEIHADDSVAADGAWRGLVTVRPEDGAFSGLSHVAVREVAGDIDDPDAWLEDRMSADVDGAVAVEDMLRSPDSPFSDPAFDRLRESLPKLFSGLEELARMPLRFCEGPKGADNASGSLRELSCEFELGPFRQFVVLRLQEVGGRWYYTEMRAMNERRLRHLVAIANSFKP